MGNGGYATKRTAVGGVHGNIVDLLECGQRNINIGVLSDQTSCHEPYSGYCPAGISFDERTRMLHEIGILFGRRSTNRCSVILGNKQLVNLGTYFSIMETFMKAIYDAGVKEMSKTVSTRKRVLFGLPAEDIMGPNVRLWLWSFPLGLS